MVKDNIDIFMVLEKKTHSFSHKRSWLLQGILHSDMTEVLMVETFLSLWNHLNILEKTLNIQLTVYKNMVTIDDKIQK